jgi:hypothetical protein
LVNCVQADEMEQHRETQIRWCWKCGKETIHQMVTTREREWSSMCGVCHTSAGGNKESLWWSAS